MSPRVVKYSAHNFIEFFGPKKKSLSLKMAEIWPILLTFSIRTDASGVGLSGMSVLSMESA